jgi:CRISPR system Cascade subunit CasD
MRRHLLLRLRAPLVAFGGEAIDARGVIRDYPALSMVTGLIANALGWDRADSHRLDRLQTRLVMGSRIDGQADRLTDFQTAQLEADDKGWTTRGVPDERRGGEGSYKSPHLRYRDYFARLDAIVALRLEPDDEELTLDDIAHALDRPMRPLFIGRKPCLPSGRVCAGFVEAQNVLDALQSHRAERSERSSRFQWPPGEGTLKDARTLDVCDERNWRTGVHGGWRPVFEGVAPVDRGSVDATVQESRV